MYCLEPVEKVEPEKVIIPVPIPFYVPVPMSMYTQPTPVPFPVPVPIPIPCFIPTTKKSADGILKHIKVMGAMYGMVSEKTLIQSESFMELKISSMCGRKYNNLQKKKFKFYGFSHLLFVLQEIREKIPNDPLEAELLMMAEAVAGVGNESDSDSEKEAEPESKSTNANEFNSIGKVLLFFNNTEFLSLCLSWVFQIKTKFIFDQSNLCYSLNQFFHQRCCTSEKTNCKSPTPTPHSTGPDATETTTTTTTASTAKAESNGDLGEDMLQMALRMASEMTEPVMDLESSIEPVPVNTGSFRNQCVTEGKST